MRRQRAANQGLLRKLNTLYKAGDECDLKMLREIQKCPESSEATPLLADALAHSVRWAGRDGRLCPEASWIHPLV